MPFSKITDPAKVAMLKDALDELCRQAGLEPGSSECDDAAGFIMRLYWNGHRTPEELKVALTTAYPETDQRYN